MDRSGLRENARGLALATVAWCLALLWVVILL